MSTDRATATEDDTTVIDILRYRPRDLKATNHNDVRSFIHAWFAEFDHAGPADYFLNHLDDADMTFTLDGAELAHDHATFRTWYADAVSHIPWDFHHIVDINIAGNADTGWGVEFFFRHVGEYLDTPNTEAKRCFDRLLHANWRLEHDGRRFIIRRYDLTIARNVLPL